MFQASEWMLCCVMTREILIFLITVAAGASLVVFAAIVYMTGTWVKMAEQLRREGRIRPRRRQNFIPNFSGQITSQSQ